MFRSPPKCLKPRIDRGRLITRPESTSKHSRYGKSFDLPGRTFANAFIGLYRPFFGLIVVSAVVRCVIRSRIRGKIFFDDVLVIVGAAYLIAATGVLYYFKDRLYMIDAVNTDSTVVFSIVEMLPLLNALIYFDIFLAFIWTAMFAIKFSFLAFYRSLIRNVSVQLSRFYAVVVVFTGVTCDFLVAEPFILCPYFGMESSKSSILTKIMITKAHIVKCYPNTPNRLNLGLTSFITVLDVITDILSRL
jgi:hypothetical protein